MWRNLLYSIFFAVQFNFYFPAYGQANFTIINYTTENSLPQNTVKDFHFDNAGFLWIATEDGLVRYDGSVFKNFSVAAVHTLNNRITSLNYGMDKRLFGRRN
jgi:ligand-binding sensor domain-containing protein